MKDKFLCTRRNFLGFGAATALAPWLGPIPRVFAATPKPYTLNAAESLVRLAGEPFPETRAWCFNGQTPGPEIRVRQGEALRIAVRNQLKEDTGIHWHGLRVPNAVDGIPFLTQPPIEPGEEYIYEYTPPDAGTYWYHSHENAAIQMGLGLHGPLIVEEREPIQVDRELVWVLDDWRLDQDAQIVQDFEAQRDYSRGGRIGNTVTLNGELATNLQVRAGERIRLRLLNSANARIFSLRFQGHQPTVIALDGQPVEPFQPTGSAVTLAPAQRADIILDMQGKPGEVFSVIDTFYPQSPYRAAKLIYSDESPLRESPLEASIRLPDNAIPKPDLTDPLFQDVLLEGGDLGRMRQAYLENKQRGLSELLLVGKFWAICGVSAFRQVMPPLVTAKRGQTVKMHLRNHTAWPHTMHLHGHTFTVLEHNGNPQEEGHLRDTVWLGPEEEAMVAFVADNPGDWLFHCHMLSHAEAGMLATVRVA